MVEVSKIFAQIPKYFNNRMIRFAHKCTEINRVLAQPGLISIGPFLHLKVKVQVVNRIEKANVGAQNRLVAANRTQATSIDDDPRYISGLANGIGELDGGYHLEIRYCFVSDYAI